MNKLTMTTLAAGLTVCSGVGLAVVWAGDQRYMTQEAFGDYMLQQRVETLEDRIFELDARKDAGVATEVDKAVLKRYQRERERLIDLQGSGQGR